MKLQAPLGRFLDFGCGSGILLESVADRCEECHGVDVNPDAFSKIAAARPEFRFSAVGMDGRIGYPDDFFDTVAAIEVIEHVPDESIVLSELARVLKPGGRLLLTTRHRGLLTFLDVGNVKFAFPRLHRFIHHRILRQNELYQRQFGGQRTNRQLVGDVSAAGNRRPWHRHYKAAEILAFCPALLQLQSAETTFPGERAFGLARVVLRVLCCNLLQPFPPPLPQLERWLSRVETRCGDNLVMLFSKRG